jgi:hypothetical protein
VAVRARTWEGMATKVGWWRLTRMWERHGNPKDSEDGHSESATVKTMVVIHVERRGVAKRV